MAKSKLDKAVVIMLFICLIVLIYFGTCGLVFFRKKPMSIGVYSQVEFLNAYGELVKDFEYGEFEKGYYKSIIKKDLKPKFYIYSERTLKSHCGLTLPTIRLIIIDERLQGNEYCVTLAHETMHLNQFIREERYVCYETFKYLYESEELHNVGVWYGLKQLNGDYSGEYDISGLVVNYLTNK